MLLAKRERTSFLFSWQLRGALILSAGFYLAQFWTKQGAQWSRERGNRAGFTKDRTELTAANAKCYG